MKHIIIGAGALGIHLFKQLKKQGEDVLIVSRSKKQIDGQDVVVCDIRNVEALSQLVDANSVIYNALGLPYKEWYQLPSLIDNLISVASQTNSLLVYADNLYAYGHVSDHFDESTSYNASGKKQRIRKEMLEKVINAAKTNQIQMVVGMSSDFYGPYATNSSLSGSQVFDNIMHDKSAMFIGDVKALHIYTYIEDFARALIVLGRDYSAHNRVWHVPNDESISIESIVKQLEQVSSKTIKYASLKKPLFSIVALFNPMIREINEMYYMFNKSFLPNSDAFKKKYPDFKITPIEEGLLATWEWYQTK